MKVAVLETGRPPGNLAEDFGDYPTMFGQLLGAGSRSRASTCRQGVSGSRGAPAYLITGSPAGVYDDLPWIEPLQQFIREADGAKMIGICFGHQVMAEALGGHVEKSDKGWGAGLHHYTVVRSEPWIERRGLSPFPPRTRTRWWFSRRTPTSSRRPTFTPFAALAWTDRPAISFQFHPEFSPAFAKALIEKRYDAVPNPDAAIASLDAPNDSACVGRWIRNFLNGGTE